MSRILLAWELGANFGHLFQLAAIGERLRADGHHLLFAVRDLKNAAEVLAPRGFEFVQAPIFHRRERAPQPPINHAEMLALAGYSDEAQARGMVSGWMKLLDLFRVDSIVADYAPGALLAGRVLSVPRAHIGTGFEIPPLVSPMPSIRPWENVPVARLAGAEQELLERVNRVVRSLQGNELECLADWFRSDARIFTTFPELDPFGPRSDERYVGPIYAYEAGDPAAWPEGALPRIFAYLRADVPGAQNILKALAGVEARTLCVAPGLPATMLEGLASERLAVVSRPVCLESALNDAALAVMYGGHGVLCAALARGVPIFVAPQNVEQLHHAQRVAASGAGVLIGRDRSVAAVASGIAQALQDEKIRAGARQFSARHAALHPARAVAEAATIISALARGSPKVLASLVGRETGTAR